MTGITKDLQVDATCRPFGIQHKSKLKLANCLAITPRAKTLVGPVVDVLTDEPYGTIAKNKLGTTSVI